MVKEDWCKTRFTGFDDFISFDLYVKLQKEEFDNFDKEKYKRLFIEMQEYATDISYNTKDVEEISEMLECKFG